MMAEFHTPIKSVKKTTLPATGEKITIPPSPYLSRLGYGTGVNVVQLVRSPKAGEVRSPWALKMLNKRIKPNKIITERLQEEADLLKRMSHPNIVGFRAFDNSKILYLGMEACDVSLGDMIEKRVEDNVGPFPQKPILKVALDMGNALDYLHTNVKILHGDIKSYNILVNGDFAICKLCDFGVTLPLDKNGNLDKEKAGDKLYTGTEAWCAPEVFSDETITTKTDIWALGLTLWEMMSLLPPHTNIDLNCTGDASFSTDCSIEEEDLSCENYGTRPAVPRELPLEQYREALALFWSCTEVQRRPTARQLADAAADMLEEHLHT